ncbi:MAG: HAMP domain-containing histidine kinase [Chloroflexota bacterium]|nr:HAMP domain-containing histidine kinase [Chloroflexota bacterium]
MQVLLPDAAGRLQTFAVDGHPVVGGRLRSSRRRKVFESKRPMQVTLQSPAGCALALYPLVVDGRSVGVIEIVAPVETLERRRDVIDAVVGQSAIVFRSVIEKRESDDALRSMGGMLRLASELLRAETPSSAVKSAVQLCFQRTAEPILGLLPDPSGIGWSVAAARGIGAAKRAELRRSVEDVGTRGGAAENKDRLAACFAAIVGRTGAEPLEAGGAVMIVAELRADDEEFLRTAAAFVGEALDRIGTVDWAQTRNENLDLAIAWTAHELKGPLVGARAALDRVTVGNQDRTGQDLLRRSRDELGQLADLVDPLLRWSAGSFSLRMRRCDLVRIVRDAVTSGRLEAEEPAVVIEAPEHVWVRGNAQQLGQAIANVVRNAVSHAPRATTVRVTVEETNDGARVRVRDRGPGVPASERRLIFDPFARGMSANGRGGSGLGLFIARRIVEAHQGSIGLRSARPGTEFFVELPLAEEGRSTSAS